MQRSFHSQTFSQTSNLIFVGERTDDIVSRVVCCLLLVVSVWMVPYVMTWYLVQPAVWVICCTELRGNKANLDIRTWWFDWAVRRYITDSICGTTLLRNKKGFGLQRYRGFTWKLWRWWNVKNLWHGGHIRWCNCIWATVLKIQY